MESLVLCANIFNNSTIVVYCNFPGRNYRHHLKDAENYPMAMFKLSGLILNHSEEFSESEAITAEGTELQTVGWWWLEKSGESILPESLCTLTPTKEKRAECFPDMLCQVQLTQCKFISSGSKLADGGRPQEGNTYRQTKPPEKLCILPPKSQRSNKFQGSRSSGRERGSSKAKGSNFFPHFDNSENI